MKAKRRARSSLQPLVETIAQDAKNKKALRTEFLSFYTRMKKAMRGKSELKELEIPLERVKKSVQAAAHGIEFGTPLVTVEEPKSWKG